MNPKVAVVTPYYKEEESVLRQCLDSVAAQTIPVRHILHADGFPAPWLVGRDIDHILSSSPHRDNGNFGRAVAALHAFQQGYEFVAFLDADNWLAPNHCETLVAALRASGGEVGASGRTMVTQAGQVMLPWDPTSDGVSFADTSTLMVRRSQMGLMLVWLGMPPQMGPACDQIFWLALRERKIPVIPTNVATLYFRSQYADHYRVLGHPVPPGAKEKSDMDATIAYWHTLAAQDRAHLLSELGATPPRALLRPAA